MTGRGVDQVLPHPGDPELRERYAADARAYVRLAERAHGPIPRPAGFAWPWGDALPVLEDVAPDVRVINLETSIIHHVAEAAARPGPAVEAVGAGMSRRWSAVFPGQAVVRNRRKGGLAQVRRPGRVSLRSGAGRPCAGRRAVEGAPPPGAPNV